MLEPTVEELLAEAKPLGRKVTKVDDRNVFVDGKGHMKLKEFHFWIARERVRQALVRAGGLPE